MEWTQDVSLGQWIIEGTSGSLGNDIADLVPRGFDAYAKILHPEEVGILPILPQAVRLLMEYTSTPTNATAAIWEGWGGLASSGGQASLMLANQSTFLTQVCLALQRQWLHVLSQFRPPPQLGTGILPADVAAGPKLEMPDRAYYLVRLDLHDLATYGWEDRVLWADPPLTRTPSLLWPDDHAWVLATEIDLDWTVIAGSCGLVEDLIRSDLHVIKM